jgi:hypothetical protein
MVIVYAYFNFFKIRENRLKTKMRDITLYFYAFY